MEDDFERQKQAAIARLRRKVEAARYVFEDGDISREEYLKRRMTLEWETAQWEARTTDVQKAVIELRMCMEVPAMMTDLWDESADEDKQGIARMVFQEIVYDQERLQTAHVTLKP